jgi:hypothetical protein
MTQPALFAQPEDHGYRQWIPCPHCPAVFSSDRKRRYELVRVRRDVTTPLRTLGCVGVNPSKASETRWDNTIKKLTRFADAWGFQRFVMTNLFPFVSTYPKDLLSDEAVGAPDDVERLVASLQLVDLVLCALGRTVQPEGARRAGREARARGRGCAALCRARDPRARLLGRRHPAACALHVGVAEADDLGGRVSSVLIFQVATALLTGATLTTPRASVGPYRLATDSAAVARFACLDLQGAVVDAREAWVEIECHVPEDREGWAAEREVRTAHDWSAFGAARAFVERELRYSRHSVEIALKDLVKKRLLGTNVGRDPGPPYSTAGLDGARDRAEHVRRCRAIRCKECRS